MLFQCISFRMSFSFLILCSGTFGIFWQHGRGLHCSATCREWTATLTKRNFWYVRNYSVTKRYQPIAEQHKSKASSMESYQMATSLILLKLDFDRSASPLCAVNSISPSATTAFAQGFFSWMFSGSFKLSMKLRRVATKRNSHSDT